MQDPADAGPMHQLTLSRLASVPSDVSAVSARFAPMSIIAITTQRLGTRSPGLIIPDKEINQMIFAFFFSFLF